MSDFSYDPNTQYVCASTRILKDGTTKIYFSTIPVKNPGALRGRPSKKFLLTDEKKRKIDEMRGYGLSWRKIAKHFDTSEYYIRKHSQMQHQK